MKDDWQTFQNWLAGTADAQVRATKILRSWRKALHVSFTKQDPFSYRHKTISLRWNGFEGKMAHPVTNLPPQLATTYQVFQNYPRYPAVPGELCWRSATVAVAFAGELASYFLGIFPETLIRNDMRSAREAGRHELLCSSLSEKRECFVREIVGKIACIGARTRPSSNFLL